MDKNRIKIFCITFMFHFFFFFFFHQSWYTICFDICFPGQNYPWIFPPPPPIFFFKYYYICVLILAILFYKITFYFSLTISLIFLRVMLLTNFFITFLQTFLVANFYWFVYGHTIYIIFFFKFLLTSNHLLHK